LIRLIPHLIFLSTFALFLRSLAPSVALEDSGDLITCALALFNTHPPGYPLHSLAGRLFSLIPVGSQAFRINLLSAACGGLSLVALWFFIVEILGKRSVAAVLAAAAGVAGLALSRTLWWQSAIAEKYTMALALFAWTALMLFRAARSSGRRDFLVSAFLMGLTLSHHLTGIYLLPLMGLCMWKHRERSSLVLAVFLIVIPLGVKTLYPALRSGSASEVTWGSLDRADRLWEYLRAGRYVRKFAVINSEVPAVVKRVLDHAIVIPWKEFGAFVLFAIAGFAVLLRRQRDAGVWIGVLLAANLVFGVVYRTPEVERLYLPAFWLAAALAGMGVFFAAEKWKLALGVAGVLLMLEAWNSSGYAVRNRDYTCPDHVRNLMALVEGDSVVIGWGDVYLLPLMTRRDLLPSGDRSRLLPAEDLMLGSPGRRKVAEVLGGKESDISGFQESPALVWEIARLAGSREVFLTRDSIPGLIPSRGLKRHGLMLRVTDSGEDLGVDIRSWRIMESLRLRSLLGRKGLFETLLAEYYARVYLSHGEAALAAGDARLAEKMARRGLFVGHGFAQLHEFAGRVAFSRGDFETAQAQWGEALLLTENSYVEPYVGRAAAAMAKGDWETAISNWRFAAIYAVGSRNPALAAADDYRRRGMKEEALSGYRKAAATGLLNRGMAEFTSGRIPEAARDWERVVEMDPESVRALGNLGSLAAYEERFEDAMDLFRRALTHSKDPAELTEIRENMERAADAIKWRGKLKELEAKVFLEGDAPAFLCDLGNAYWYMGRTRVAEHLYRKALAEDRNFVRAWGNLGSALAQQGDGMEAIRVYEKALDVRPDYAEAMINIGAVYQGLGEDKKAEKWLRRALVISPGNPQALYILSLLSGSPR